MLNICRRRSRRRSNIRLSRKELERTTDIFFADSQMAENNGNEACMTENGVFVGTTAGFDDSWAIVPLRPDLRPAGVDPDFEVRQTELVNVARKTCFIGVSQSNHTISGTAFFVSKTILMTAGHMAPDGNRKIVAQYPGVRRARMFVQDLFESPPVPTFECEFVATGLPNVDITILRVKGTYQADDYVSIERKWFVEGEGVDVLGYPGQYSVEIIRKMHGGSTDRKEVLDVGELFPRCELTVSYGTVAAGGNMPMYRVSTIVGMSGSPVVVCGKIVGVHRGHSGLVGDQCNQCVAFAGAEVWKFLGDQASTNVMPKKGFLQRPRWMGGGSVESWPGDDPELEDEPERTPSRTQVAVRSHRATNSVGSKVPY